MRYLLSVAVSRARDILPELEKIGALKMNTRKQSYTLDIASDVSVELVFLSGNTGVCFIDVAYDYDDETPPNFVFSELLTMLNNYFFRVSEDDVIWYRTVK